MGVVALARRRLNRTEGRKEGKKVAPRCTAAVDRGARSLAALNPFYAGASYLDRDFHGFSNLLGGWSG